MLRNLVVAGLSSLFATAALAATPSPMIPPSQPVPSRALQPRAVEPASATLNVGDTAPAFSYMGNDGSWHHLDDLVADGALLLVFGASDRDLASIDEYSPAFRELGVTPVAILRMATRGTRATAKRLQLESRLLADPMCAIAGLYNSLDPTSCGPVSSYFVLDQGRRIRAMRYGPLPPPELLVASAARALGRPLPPSILSGYAP
jgi:peroxiredoxin